MREEFYKVDTSVSKRESFNNTILLLTMIKSEYYYIIGFSRVKGQIEIGFDYKSDLHNVITESVIIDFYSDENNLVLYSEIKNINPYDFDASMKFVDNFYYEKGTLKYKLLLKRDTLIPVSIEKMNSIIMKTKSQVFEFLERYYMNCIHKG